MQYTKDKFYVRWYLTPREVKLPQKSENSENHNSEILWGFPVFIDSIQSKVKKMTLGKSSLCEARLTRSQVYESPKWFFTPKYIIWIVANLYHVIEGEISHFKWSKVNRFYLRNGVDAPSVH